MKKLLSVLLSAAMLCALALPAFAANPITNESEASGETIVQTDISGITGNGYFSVSYPAEMNIVWGTASTQFGYTITSQLKVGKAVKVDVAAAHNVMTSAATATLAYSLSGELTATAAGSVVTNEAHNFNVLVNTSAWNAAAIDEYSDTITFTASVV